MKIATTLALLLASAALAHAELPSATDAAVASALRSGKPTVIDLGARTCIPCRKMAPILENLAAEYRGKASVLFIDVNENQAAAEKFRVQMIPTQVFFDKNGKEIKRHIGSMEKTEMVRDLKAAGLK
ncbi:thioredoxin family protein [Geomonas ferrireducens]|jgi:thioredoxin 1|uniref:thioredoxin family protein n=1 Tax=Geomonas ferrireducens TaxID=2570227 RepID=UPI0010A7B24E|nr:thioredoxin family protein [Geomonas ferrireducens]